MIEIKGVVQGIVLWLEQFINPGLPFFLASIMALIAIVGTHPIRVTTEQGFYELVLIRVRQFIFLAISGLAVLIPATLFFATYAVYDGHAVFSYIVTLSADAIAEYWWLVTGAYALVAFWRWVGNRYIPTYLSKLKRKYAIRVSTDTLSDIRSELNSLSAKNFEVRKYYKQDKMFVGIDGNNKPIYIDDDMFCSNNMQVIGPSQTGKGVAQQVLIDQGIRKGWNVIFIDQKPDDFIIDVMRETCEDVNRNFFTLDLNGVGKGTYCPFFGGTDRERYQRFINSCGLTDTGSDSDFYKAQERAAISEIIPHWDGSIKELDYFIKSNDSKIAKKLGEFKTKQARLALNKVKSQITEWRFLDTINAQSGRGFNVERTIKENAVALIRGSVNDKTVIKFTKVIIDEIVATLLRLGKNSKPAHTMLVIDEARFIISDELAKAMATMLSKGCSTMISYQSVKDTENLDDRTANAKSISQSINVNSNLILCYRAKDSETAEWLAEQTGTIQKMVARFENVERNRHGGEMWANARSLNQAEETLIHKNTMLALPPRVGVLIKPGSLATLVFTSWLPINKSIGLEAKTKRSTQEATEKPKQQPQTKKPEKGKKEEKTDTAKPGNKAVSNNVSKQQGDDTLDDILG